MTNLYATKAFHHAADARRAVLWAKKHNLPQNRVLKAELHAFSARLYAAAARPWSKASGEIAEKMADFNANEARVYSGAAWSWAIPFCVGLDYTKGGD